MDTMEETVVETWIGTGVGSSVVVQLGVGIVEEGRGGGRKPISKWKRMRIYSGSGNRRSRGNGLFDGYGGWLLA